MNLGEMMTDKIYNWDVFEFIDNPEAMAEYLIAAFEDGDPTLICAVIEQVAQALGLRLEVRALEKCDG